MTRFKSYNLGRTNPLMFLVVFVFALIAIYWLAKGVFTILTWAFPVVLIATAVINYRVLFGYGRWVIDNIKRSPVIGIVIAVLTVMAYPFVGLFLLYRAISSKSKPEQQTNGGKSSAGDYIKYEEVEQDEDFLDLSELEESKKEIKNRYDELF